MPTIEVFAPVNLREFVRHFDTPLSVSDLPGGGLFVDLSDGHTAELSASGLSLTMYDGLGGRIEFTLDDPVSYDGTNFNLQDVLEAEAEFTFYDVHDPRTVVKAFGDKTDYITGIGRLHGREGDDFVTLFALNEEPGAPRSYAFGNEGHDALVSQLDRATLVGGAGNDTLIAMRGNTTMIGGDGLDEFQFRSESFGERVFGRIRDFDNAEDRVTFAHQDGFAEDADPFTGTLISFASLFGTADLGPLSRGTYDGVDFRFQTASNGDALIKRRGTDDMGNQYWDTVRFEGLLPNEVDANRIYIMLYDDLGFAL